MKSQYIKCPRCELNYILKKDKFCEVCKQEMKAGSLELDELDEFEEGVELCPICKVNYLTDGESICVSCQEEQSAYDKDEDIDWKSEVEKSNDEEDDLDLLPVEDNDEINEELQTAFSKDLDEDFMDDNEEDYEYVHEDDDDDFDDSYDDLDDSDDDEDDEDDVEDFDDYEDDDF